MIILLYIFNIIAGFVGGLLIARFGSRFGFVDMPIERSSHFFPTPKGGAIGILTGFLVTANYLNLPGELWISAVALALVSLLGDRSEISPHIRLWVQFSCSIIFLIGIFYSRNLFFLWYIFVIPLAIYLVGTSNFYNFMDGINGIAGITGVVGFLLIAVFGIIIDSDPKYVTVSVAIACSCLGFLPHNIPGAKVFMGDVGSVLLGFVFGSLVVALSRTPLDFICLSGFLFPFYADALTTMFIRIKDGETLNKPHRRHFYQILANECKLKHWKIAVGYGGLQLFVGIVLISLRDSCGVVLVCLMSFLLLFSFATCLVRYLVCNKYVGTLAK